MAQDPASGQRVFGRRATPPPAPVRPTVPAPQPEAPLPDGITWTEHRDTELEDWKRARRRHLPWRQISFMASLCFGIGALVLPDRVTGVVDWLLWGLAGMSFWSGWRRRS